MKAILLALILTFSFFNCTYKILDNPPSLFSDEADANYQAFVFNHRQSDYFGNKFPIHFHSFSDWRTSLYIYSISLVQIFTGHRDLAARLPSAIYSTLTVFVFFLIIEKLFKNKNWALIGTLLFSFSPWLIHYGRTGFEVSGMLFVILLGIYFWIRFIKENKNLFLFLSTIFFITSIYFYSTAKLFLIFIFIILYILWFKTINSLPFKTKVTVILISFLFCLPFIFDFIRGRAGYRFSYINIFSDPTVSETVNHLRQEDSFMVFGPKLGVKTLFVSKIFYNKLQQWSEMFIKNYFSAFSTEFLFLKGDGNLRQGFQTAGYLLYPDLFFCLLGISAIFSKKRSEDKKMYLFFLFSLICAPIPFALTRDSIFPHGTRLFLMLPFLIFLSLLGIKFFFEIVQSKLLITFILMIYFFCFARFNHQYFFHYPNISAREWHMGMKQAVLASLENKDQWEKIYYSNSYEPFMPFFLNYSEYLPEKTAPGVSFKWDNTNYFTGMQAEDKFYLGNIEWPLLLASKPSKNNLYVVSKKDMLIIEKEITKYSKADPTEKLFYQIGKIDKKYTEQELFYLVSFNL